MANHQDILARTIWGEARGEGVEGMAAVASVVLNRLADRRWPNTITDVARQPRQFSAWNKNDPNRQRMKNVTNRNREFQQALQIADTAVKGNLKDNTNGANHFHTRAVRPRWSAGRQSVARIGRHIFFRL